jgi:HEPN domain-containing protein
MECDWMPDADSGSMLTIARPDLKAAQALQDASIGEASWGFQVQQVVDKALKAWLYQLGDFPPFTPDWVLLFKRLLRAGADVESYRDLARFTDFAVQIRYDADLEPMDLDRSHWLQRASTLVEHVEQIVGRGA